MVEMLNDVIEAHAVHPLTANFAFFEVNFLIRQTVYCIRDSWHTFKLRRATASRKRPAPALFHTSEIPPWELPLGKKGTFFTAVAVRCFRTFVALA